MRYVLGRRVNFKCFSVLLQDGKICGNFYLDPMENILTCNQPHEDVFSCMLECLFTGPIQHVAKPNVLTEPLWNLAELHRADLRLKMHKCGDDVGLTAEVFKHVPAEFCDYCCRCTMTSFITALCLDRGVPLYLTCCPKRCDQHKLLIFGR